MQQLEHGMVIEYGHAERACLLREHGLLIVSVVFEPDAGTSGKGVPAEHEVVPVGLHVDAPLLPLPHDGGRLLHELIGEQRIVAAADLTFHEFLKDDVEIVAVDFGKIAEEVIAAASAGTAASGVGFFQNNDAGALFGR